MSFITSYCHINNENCSINGKIVAEFDADSADSWLKQLYKSQELVYPKFYKMDSISQAGIIGSELLKRSHSSFLANYGDDEIAMVFANNSSSADSDLKFQRSYKQQHAPSPSLFVYTLPNIVIGEIAILNKWYGENMCAVLPKFAPDFFVNYGNILTSQGSEAILSGWMGIENDKMNVFVFLVEKQGETGMEFSIDNLIRIAGPTLT